MEMLKSDGTNYITPTTNIVKCDDNPNLKFYPYILMSEFYDDRYHLTSKYGPMFPMLVDIKVN